VCFYPYQNFNPQTSEPANNLSRFKNTGFITTEFLYGMEIEPGESAIPETFVDLQSVEGILFKGNTFQNLATTSDESRGTGIRSGSAGFYVYNECAISNTTPCPEYYISIFEHLDYGILVLDDRESLPIVIDSATFTDNKRGILMSGVNNAEIFHNTFEMDMPDSYHSTSDTLIGVYLEACQEFLLTENYFTGYSGTQMDHAAIYTHNLGPYYNEIYNNSIENLSCGIVTAGENRNGNAEGLCILCNDFTDCQYDVYIIPYGGMVVENLGIAKNQGMVSGQSYLPAANTFTDDEEYQDLEYNIYNDPDDLVQINYYHHENQLGFILMPYPVENVHREPMLGIIYNKEASCPSLLSGGIDLLYENTNVINESSIILDYTDSLNLLVDGGSTESLSFDIQTSMPYEAMDLRQQLLNESPYLSDTVMKSAIEKENVLPNVMIKDILVANPHSVKSPDLLRQLNNRLILMPDYWMAEIMDGINYYGAKELLEKSLALHSSARAQSFMKLISEYKYDTLNAYARDSLKNLLKTRQNVNAKYRLAYLYLMENDSTTANNIIDSIPINFVLDDNEQFEHGLHNDLVDIQNHYWNNNYSLDSIDIQNLQSISSNINTLQGIYSRNLLVINNLQEFKETIYLPDNLKSGIVWDITYNSNTIETSIVQIYPNPSYSYFIIEYDLNEPVESGKIIISDVLGKQIQMYRIEGQQNQILCSTDKYTTGMYFVHVFINNELVENHKLNIVK